MHVHQLTSPDAHTCAGTIPFHSHGILIATSRIDGVLMNRAVA